MSLFDRIAFGLMSGGISELIYGSRRNKSRKFGDLGSGDANDPNSTAVSSGIENLGRKVFGTGLTDAEKAANQFSSNEAQKARDYEERMSNTSYQRAVADMEAAGVNPALMYGSGASGASTPSASGVSSVSPSTDPSMLFQALMLPFQLRNLSAQTDSIRQGVLESKQRIEESKSRVRYQNILSDYYPQLTDAQIREIDAAVKEKLSNVVVNDKRASNLDADTALKNVHRSLAKIQERYADEFNSLQNAVLGAKSEESRANAALAYTRKAMDDLEKQYMKDYSMKMGTNEYLGLAVSLCSLFGANAKELVGTITDGIKEHMRELGEAISKGGNPHPGT